MGISRLRSTVRALSASLVIAFSITAMAPMLSTPERSTAEASVAFDKSDSKDKEKKEKAQERSQQEDRVLNGQVLEINTLKDPPELIVGSVDGETVVRVLKTDEIAMNGVHVGDSIEADGEKINEQLFEATQLSVSSRYTGESNDNEDSGKKN
jgi:hypothetical protein